MPRLSRWMIRTAFSCLVAGLAVGLLRAALEAGVISGAAARWWLPQLHLLTVGWLTQLIFGVAYWLFPKARDSSRHWVKRSIWTAYVLLNGGLLLRLVFEPTATATESDARDAALLVSSALQWIAALLLTGAFWHRVRAK